MFSTTPNTCSKTNQERPDKQKGHPTPGIAAETISNKDFAANNFSGRTTGKVILVGFGPGDPELLTIKGYKALAWADEIYFDNLVDHEFIQQFKGRKFYVGKRKNHHSLKQEEINRLLLYSVYAGNNVVRLKGGNPMIFARAGEEIEYLQKYNVKVEVIPGITSALAAAASAKIPLTQRGITSSVTFVSGHRPENLDFSGNSTVVVYMGAANVRAIAFKAISHGRDPQSGALLISNVSLPNQKHDIVTLKDLESIDQKYQTPLIIIIGSVVDNSLGLQKQLLDVANTTLLFQRLQLQATKIANGTK